MRMRLAECWSIWATSSKRKVGSVPAPARSNCNAQLLKAKLLHEPEEDGRQERTLSERLPVPLRVLAVWQEGEKKRMATIS